MMRRNLKKRVSALVIAFVLVLGTIIPGMMVFGEDRSFDLGLGESEDETIVLAYADTEEELEELRAYGRIIDHYGRHVLIETTESGEEELKAEYNNHVRDLDHRNELIINDVEFDTDEGLPLDQIDDDLKIDGYEPGTEGIYLVDLIGPVNSEWREILEEKGVEVMNYVPNYAYRVQMTPEVAEEVERFEFVDWVGIYQPAFKLQSGLEPGLVEIGLTSGADHAIEEMREKAGPAGTERPSPAAAEDEEKQVWLSSESGHEQDEHSVFSYTRMPDGEFRIRMEVDSEEDLHDIAHNEHVYYINRYEEPEIHEMESQLVGGGLWFMDDEDGDPSDPYRKHGDHGAYMNQIGYTGEDVTITIADTGIGDGEEGDAGHPDFTGRVVGGHVWDEDIDSWEDAHYHGTHCAGLAAGDTYQGTGETYAGEETGDYYLAQGLASDSELYSARIFGPGGGWVGPEEDYFEIVEVPAQESDTYVHSNSWGADTEGQYVITSSEFDAAVRDADRDTEENEPMVITVSAGNAGPEDQTVGAPATGKNLISVGATYGWSPDGGDYGGVDSDNPENMAGYSSRGWTADNRIKPDVVAPAELTLSTQTPLTGGNYGPNTEQYRWMGGTSSSNPVAAGAASLVVEWYEENHGERPSPAMVRSLLVNTAEPLDEEIGNTRGPIPNRDEGWGMVDISKLEYPVEEPVPFFLEDQDLTFENSGEVEEYEIEYDDPSEPLKVTLGWTDKEAPPDTWEDPALINDLNLEVESPGGHVYRGNAFEDGWTQRYQDAMEDFDRKGDGWDDTNNLQNVYIPTDELEMGVYTVRVEAYEIAEDAVGIGNNSQDFALSVYNGEEGEVIGDPPTVDLERPTGGEVWESHTEEEIEWSAQEGDDPISETNLWYSYDGGEEWELIAEGLDVDSYTWDVQNTEVPEVDEARIRVRTIDEEGRFADSVSDQFTVEGVPPEPPEHPLVEYSYIGRGTIFEDDVSEDKGYTTESSEGVNEWEIRDHGSSVGDQSWDWGDTEYEKVGELSSLISPEIEIPEEAEDLELTFEHWRAFEESDWFNKDGSNLKISTHGADGPWELIEDPDPGYDGEIGTGWENPLAEEPVWLDQQDWEKVTVDLDDPAEDSIWLRWDVGVENIDESHEGGYRVDNITLEGDIELDEPQNNQVRWYSSPSEEMDEVSHYNIYRFEDQEGPWDEDSLIDTVEADGSEIYQYVDPGPIEEEPYYWYLVRAEGINELEEDNEEAKQEQGDPDVQDPEITINLPDSGSVWNAYDEENIEWTTSEGDEPIDYIDRLWYSTDGEEWVEIDDILDDEDYLWEVPNWPSEEAQIRARIVDEYGRYQEDTSEEFEIIGQAPEGPTDLDVQHVDMIDDWHWLYPDDHRVPADSALGYPSPATYYGAIRTELPEGEVTDLAHFEFDTPDHVKGYLYEDEVDEPGEKLGETEERPGVGGAQWREMPLKEPVQIEEDHYWIVIEVGDAGEDSFPLGLIEPNVEDGLWHSDDGLVWNELDWDFTWAIEAHVDEIIEEGNQDNMLTWTGSGDDPADGRPEEVNRYNIYRAETDFEGTDLVGSVDADGSDEYIFVDEDAGMGDDTFWWYNISAVAHNEMETHHVETVREPIPPDIDITAPEEDEEWEYGDTETITWTTTEHDHEIHEVDLFYSLDDGETVYDQIAEGLDPADGEYDWDIPDVYSEEARVVAHIYDVEDNWRENVSDNFTIIGDPPEAPEGLLIEDEDGDNRVRWYASPDEDIEEVDVTHYNIYRAETEQGPWDEDAFIGSVEADGSEQYHHIDEDMAGEPYHWYVVRTVDHYGQEELNEDAKPEPGIPDVGLPSITIERPHSGSVWDAYEEEEIEWQTTEGDAPVDYIELWYSTDGGENWTQIGGMHPDEDYLWEVANWPSEESKIRARVVDENGLYQEDTSEEFEIVGEPPVGPQDLEVEHSAPLDWYYRYDDEHRAEPDNALGIGDPGGVWYGAIRERLPEGQLTEIAYHDHAQAEYVKGEIYTDGDGGEEPGDLIAETQEFHAPGSGEWVEIPLVEPVEIDRDDYWIVLEIDDPGDGYFPFGVIDPYVEDGGWISMDGEEWDETIDFDLDTSWALEVQVEEKALDDNLITWSASEDDPAEGRPEEVDHYEIYRSEEDWDEAESIGTVPAVGSGEYHFVDEGAGLADDIYWWYNVTAVAHNEMKTSHAEAVREPAPPLDHLEIDPEEKTVSAGEEAEFAATAYNETYGELIDITSEAEWSIEEGAGGEWDQETGVYTSENEGEWTVDALYTKNGQEYTDSATLVVEPVYELVINEPVGEGTVEVDGQEVTEWPYEETYDENTDVELTAVPEDGWFLEEWTGDYIGTEEEITITMDENKEITAVFEEEVETYELTIDVEGEGTVEIDPDEDEYEEGTEVELTAIPDEGWEFQEWTGDHEGTEDEITITMDEDKEITAVFEEEVEFEVRDFNVEVDGLEVTVTAEVENIGNATGTIELIIDDEVVEEETLDPGESESIEYTHEFDEEGEYTIELGDQSETVSVEEEEDEFAGIGMMTWMLIGIIVIIVIILAVIGYMKKGGEETGTGLEEKIEEEMETEEEGEEDEIFEEEAEEEEEELEELEDELFEEESEETAEEETDDLEDELFEEESEELETEGSEETAEEETKIYGEEEL